MQRSSSAKAGNKLFFRMTIGAFCGSRQQLKAVTVTIFAKSCILDVRLSSEYVFESIFKYLDMRMIVALSKTRVQRSA